MKKDRDLRAQAGAVPENLSPQQIFNSFIDGLNQRRHAAREEHLRHQERSPSKFADTGSIDIYSVSMQIEGAVNLAKELGIVDKDADPDDFLK